MFPFQKTKDAAKVAAAVANARAMCKTNTTLPKLDPIAIF